eukprot:417579-Amphidinium_carterae.1
MSLCGLDEDAAGRVCNLECTCSVAHSAWSVMKCRVCLGPVAPPQECKGHCRLELWLWHLCLAQEQRESLPIYKLRDELLQVLGGCACREVHPTKTSATERRKSVCFSSHHTIFMRDCAGDFAFAKSGVQAIHDNQVMIVIGETGSGKTTQITQYLAEVPTRKTRETPLFLMQTAF